MCNWSPSLITVHAKRFTNECQNEVIEGKEYMNQLNIGDRAHRIRRIAPMNVQSQNDQLADNALYEADMLDTSSAWIYPVEPPKNRVEYAKLTANVRSTSMNTGVFAERVRTYNFQSFRLFLLMLQCCRFGIFFFFKNLLLRSDLFPN